MTARPIGYYVHHHGAGHRARADAIAAVIDAPIVLLGTGIGDAGIDLCDDRPDAGGFDGIDGAADRPSALHYAPVDHDGVRRRVARMAQWIADARPALLVVDVSAEVAMLARLASVPTIYVRLNGDRSDPAHLDAFRGAQALLAPFHPDLEPASTPKWVRAKTHYCPGITATVVDDRPDANHILVVVGRGGPPANGEAIAQAARTCPDHIWRVIGPATPSSDPPPNLQIVGWVDSPAREIARAALVIGAAGDGLVNAVLAADRPFICIPQDRPYDEQRATADRLAVLGAATVLADWPKPQEWPTLIVQTQAMPPQNRTRLHDPLGAEHAAQWIAEVAAKAIPTMETVA